MRKKGTSGRAALRWLRRTGALFLAAVGLWIVWVTGDPAAAADRLRTAAGDVRLAMALLDAELHFERGNGELTFADRLVLGQSPLLQGWVEREEPADEPATPSPESSAPGLLPVPSPPASTTAPEDIIEKTMVAGTTSKYITEGKLTIYNHTDYTPDIGALLASAPKLTPSGEGPQVLIFHSHATEAYTMDGTDLYEESDSYRTLDTRQNMVRIGEEMKKILEAAGISVIHDTTLYDYPSYNEAYSRSGAGVAKWLEEYPSIQLVMDVHRDALAAADGTIYKTAAGTLEGCAQVMLVMGSDAMGQEHPHWRTNLAFALSIQQALTEKWATLARPLVLRTSRFNQQLSTGMILVEVGTHGNTLQEALTAARIFARTVADMMG